jgi:hypothetical protein
MSKMSATTPTATTNAASETTTATTATTTTTTTTTTTATPMASTAPTGGPRRPLEIAEALATVEARAASAAVLVEGWSDEAAVEALARRCADPSSRAHVVVLPIGGVTNLARFAGALRATHPAIRLAGLYDASEERLALRALTRAGVIAAASRAQAEAAGFFACESDLEDELIRALGPEAVQNIVAREDELASFRRFQAQPEHRGRALHPQLKRFLGTRAGRKIRYGTLLVEALESERVPVALRRLLAHALHGSSSPPQPARDA